MLEVEPTGQRGRTATGSGRNGLHIVSPPSGRYVVDIHRHPLAVTFCQARGYLPSFSASPPLTSRSILLGGTRV